MKKQYKTFILCLAALLLSAAVILILRNTEYLRPRASEWDEPIRRYAAEYALEPALVKAIIRVESNFDPNAKSSAEAYGLMQITEETLQWIMMREGYTAYYAAEDLYDPEINIRYGCAILARLIDEFEDPDTVLAAYNAGRSNTIKWLRDTRYSDDGFHIKTTPFKETNDYIERVHYYLNKYRTE